MRMRRIPPIAHAMVLFKNRMYWPRNPATTPSGRRTMTVPVQKASVSFKIPARESFVLPLVRYPMRPRQRTLLQGQMPATRPKMKIPESEGSKTAITRVIIREAKKDLELQFSPNALRGLIKGGVDPLPEKDRAGGIPLYPHPNPAARTAQTEHVFPLESPSEPTETARWSVEPAPSLRDEQGGSPPCWAGTWGGGRPPPRKKLMGG
jgi:hypothetical protein